MVVRPGQQFASEVQRLLGLLLVVRDSLIPLPIVHCDTGSKYALILFRRWARISRSCEVGISLDMTLDVSDLDNRSLFRSAPIVRQVERGLVCRLRDPLIPALFQKCLPIFLILLLIVKVSVEVFLVGWGKFTPSRCNLNVVCIRQFVEFARQFIHDVSKGSIR